MITNRIILLVVLVLGLSGCKHELSRAERAKALMREGNELLKQDSQLTDQWTTEYQQGSDNAARVRSTTPRASGYWACELGVPFVFLWSEILPACEPPHSATIIPIRCGALV